MSRSLRVAGAAVALLVLVSCTRESGDSPLSPSPVGRLTIDHLAASISVDGVAGVRRPGRAPAPAGGPELAAAGNDRVITGGTQVVTLRSSMPFDTVYVFVEGRGLGLLAEADGGIEGYYGVSLPAPRLEANLVLAVPQDVPRDRFDLQFAAGTPTGPAATLATTVLGVGTGDVQVTLAWDVDSDVDLHVVGPGGDEIYYGRRQSPSGGELDLDSNAGCRIDGVRNENITWPVGQAPAGQYVVRVNYWSSCGVERTNYTVRVNSGGLGAGQVVATFERLTGPAASTASAASAAGDEAEAKTGPAGGGVRR